MVSAVSAVSATRGRRCTPGTGASGKPPADRSYGPSSSNAPTPATTTKQEDEADEREETERTEAPTTQSRRGLWGGGGGGAGGQQWAEGAKRGSRCSDSSRSSTSSSAAPYYSVSSSRSSASTSATPYYSASSHGLPPYKRDFSSFTGGLEAEAARGGRERVFVSPSRDRAHCSSSGSGSSLEGRTLSGGGGGGDDHLGASGRSNSSTRNGVRAGIATVAPPSSPPSLPPLPSSACTSYSSRGSVGRMVVSGGSSLKGGEVGGGEWGHGYGQQARARGGGEAVSRVQAMEPSVRASGAGFKFRPQREGAAAAEQPPHRGGGGTQVGGDDRWCDKVGM